MNIKTGLKSTLISLVLICICLCICAGLVYYNLLTQKVGSTILFAVIVAGTLTGAFVSAKACEEKILLNAILVGIFMSLIIFISSIIINNSPALHPKTLALLGSIMGASVIGAIIANK